MLKKAILMLTGRFTMATMMTECFRYLKKNRNILTAVMPLR